MRKALLILLIGLCSDTLATTRSDKQLLDVATRQMQIMGLAGTPVKLSETSTYAIYGGERSGFVIVSKADDTDEVLGYSDTAYDAANQPCGFKWWLNAINERLQQGNVKKAAKRYTAVANFISAKWGQDSPYNDKCPMDGSQHAVTGCIATALAQVLKYYEWPAQGKGKGCYYLNNELVEEDINGIYDWANMTNLYSTQTKTVMKQAVATLMYDCGKASKMQYAKDGSGAFEYDQALGLARNFGYDSLALRCLDRDFFSDDEWMALINAEIQARRPILYTGSSQQSGGHAFVFSGIDTTGKVYVNWGWNGSYNGYFSIDALEPGGEDFNDGQTMNIGIIPMKDGYTPTDTYHSEWLSYYDNCDSYSVSGNKVRTSYYYVVNVKYLPFWGTVGFLIQSTDGQGYSAMVPVEEIDREEVPIYYGYTNASYNRQGNVTSYNAALLDMGDLPAGCYRADWASQAVQESTPSLMIDQSGKSLKPFYIGKSADGRITVSPSVITTAIADIRQDVHQEEPLYNLHGQRVLPGTKGIMIRGGKKYVVK